MDQPNFLEINACGLVGGMRGKSDGCTILGTRSAANLLSQNDGKAPLNDFEIGAEETDEGKRHMIIKYNVVDKRYYLRDLGDGSGTFVKIETALVLKNGYIISFGDSHMTVSFF